MQGSLAFKVIRGLVYRAAWTLLYVLHLALLVIAIALFCGVVLTTVDEGGGAYGHALLHLTVGQRCAIGLLYGVLGLLSVAGALKLRRWHRRINPLYPEMQISFHLARATVGERVSYEHLPRSAEPMYDRELDGGL